MPAAFSPIMTATWNGIEREAHDLLPQMMGTNVLPRKQRSLL